MSNYADTEARLKSIRNKIQVEVGHRNSQRNDHVLEYLFQEVLSVYAEAVAGMIHEELNRPTSWGI